MILCIQYYFNSKDFLLIDSTQYAHYVFKSFKQSHGGTINFEQQFLNILSLLSRGSVGDKLQWIFGLYDINGDGFITKQEMLNIVSAIYDMLGHYTDPAVTEHSAREHVERIFHDARAFSTIEFASNFHAILQD
ncbi:UNVERIFIED_CONTAM: Kv channel-interacting protein 4 [Trichonephila clavipes]